MTRRLLVLRAVLVLLFALIVFRLVQLQVLRGRGRGFVEQMRVRAEPRPPRAAP